MRHAKHHGSQRTKRNAEPLFSNLPNHFPSLPESEA
jgi:hypothetical protein